MSEQGSVRTKVLYIEDSFENRLLVRRILENRGYEFFEANDAREGFRAVEALKPDLILMDINLPDLNGFEAATRIKGTDRHRHIPIVAVTARVLPGDRERAVISGCDGYISKPIDIETFADTLQRYLTGTTETLAPEDELAYLRQYTQHLIDRLEKQIEISLVDELTGVGNLRYATLRLSEELAHCRRHRIPGSLLSCDIDSLKKINSEYGYDVGNEVLKETARLLSGNRRRFDILARTQKDEFFLFLFNVEASMARKVAERFAGQLRDGLFMAGAQRIPVSITIRGCGLDLGDSSLTPRTIIEVCESGGIIDGHRGFFGGFVLTGTNRIG